MILIGERLYDLRKDAGMTQDELAELLKISKHSISAYERDKNEPPDSIKIAIARLFNVSVDYLVGLSDMPTPANSSRVLPLPSNFPSDLLPELKDYAEFLSCKAAQHTKSKNMVNADSKKKE